MRRRTLLVAAFLLVTASVREAAGEPIHIKSPSKVETAKGSKLELPPGYFYSEAENAALDAELRRLQEAETRLTAENASLTASASEFSFGWNALGTALVVGFLAGSIWTLAK